MCSCHKDGKCYPSDNKCLLEKPDATVCSERFNTGPLSLAEEVNIRVAILNLPEDEDEDGSNDIYPYCCSKCHTTRFRVVDASYERGLVTKFSVVCFNCDETVAKCTNKKVDIIHMSSVY